MKTFSERFSKPERRRQDEQGSILFMTIFVLIVLALVATGFMALLPVEMRSARHDRAVIQGSFGSDAAVQSAMNQLAASGGNAGAVVTGANGRIDVGGGWFFQIDSVEDLGNLEFRVTTSAGVSGVPDKVMRQAVAIIDNRPTPELWGAFNNWMMDTDDDQSLNRGWPANVPIIGDVYFQGTWRVDNSMDLPDDPPITGFVYHTGTGNDARGIYSSAITTPEEFSEIYVQGIDAPQPMPEIADGFTQQGQRDAVLTSVFGTDDGAVAVNRQNTMTTGVNVPQFNNPGQMDGGIYIRHPNGSSNGAEFDVRMYTDADGNSRLWVGQAGGAGNGKGGGKNGGGDSGGTDLAFEIEFRTQGSGGADLPVEQQGVIVHTLGPNSVPPEILRGSHHASSGVTVTNTYQHGADGTPTGQLAPSATINRVTSSGLISGDLSGSVPIFIEGGVASIEGVIKGEKTLAVTTDVTLTGELLKSDVRRGDEPTLASNDVLGIMCQLEPPNSSTGMGMNMNNTPIPSDGTFHLYTHLMTLPQAQGNAGNTWMFNQPTHPDLPNNTSFELWGSITIGKMTPGHAKQTFDFFEDNMAQVTIDPKNPFPNRNRIINFTPQLRSYVEIPAGE